jgi:hypothetical protein
VARGLSSAAESGDRLLRESVEAQPVLTAGAALGIGFLVGGGLPRGAVTLLLGVGGRLAASWLSEELLARPDERENDDPL